MNYREHAPPERLAGLVECVWEMAAEEPPADSQRILPDGRVELVLNIGDPFEEQRSEGSRLQPAVLVVGPTSRHMEIRATGRVRLVGIRLRPGAARAFLHGSLERLRDRSAGAEALAVELDDLIEELRAGGAGAIGTVWRHLGSRARPAALDARARRVCEWIERSGGRVPVAELTDCSGMSPRTLQRLLARELGMGAKTFSRLVRFQEAVARLGPEGRPLEPHGWLAAGYCDQSHFLREFRRFAGVSPGRWFSVEDNRLAAEFVAAEA